jgi:3-oxoacyl-[acyl-carrier protein] reductase
MDLGLQGRRALLFGMGEDVREACRRGLESEGASVGYTGPSYGPVADGPPDIVVSGWAGPRGSNILDVDAAEELHRAWDAVESSVEIYRAALPGMEASGWGRFVWVGPASAKSLDSYVDDLGAATSLAMLAVNKLVTSEAGASNLTANAVLYGGDVSDEDVAAAVCFLCSEGAGYISGVTITVDGGAGSAMFP